MTGEGGIGKTRLIGELAGRAENAGARVAVGAGVDVGGEAPLAVWQELARELVRIVPTPPEGAGWPAELGRLAPDLAIALGRPAVPAPVAAPELERLRIFDAVLRLVEWAAAGRPVLLVAEDVHRADRASLALCAHIGRRLGRLSVLFVLTRRDRPTRPDADALLADLAGRGVDVSEIELGPLTDGALAAVARSIAPLDDADVRRVVTVAEGSPLLAVESVRALAAGSTAPPSSLRASVRATLGQLPFGAAELAESLAVAGRALAATEIDALGLADRGTPSAWYWRPGWYADTAAGCDSGTPCSPRRSVRTCGTLNGAPSRSPWRWRPPLERRVTGSRGGRPASAAGRPRRPRRAPVAPRRPARPLARRAARGGRVLDRGGPVRTGGRRATIGAGRGLRLAGSP